MTDIANHFGFLTLSMKYKEDRNKIPMITTELSILNNNILDAVHT